MNDVHIAMVSGYEGRILKNVSDFDVLKRDLGEDSVELVYVPGRKVICNLRSDDVGYNLSDMAIWRIKKGYGGVDIKRKKIDSLAKELASSLEQLEYARFFLDDEDGVYYSETLKEGNDVFYVYKIDGESG